MKDISSVSQIPKEEHYAALVSDSIHIPGDERSRTHPGHGYPESTEQVLRYVHFKDLDEVTNWVKRREELRYNQPYKIVKIKPLEVNFSVSVSDT